MTDQTRIDAGVPAGGQFAATAHAEPAVALVPPGTNLPTQDELNAMPGEQMDAANVRQWMDGEISHCISPAIGWLRYRASKGSAAEVLPQFDEAYAAVGATIARKLDRGIPAGPSIAADAPDRLERLRLKPGADMDTTEIQDWAVLELQDRLTVLRDRIAVDGLAGKDTRVLTREFMTTARGFSADIAAKFRPGPTAEDLA